MQTMLGTLLVWKRYESDLFQYTLTFFACRICAYLVHYACFVFSLHILFIDLVILHLHEYVYYVSI